MIIPRSFTFFTAITGVILLLCQSFICAQQPPNQGDTTIDSDNATLSARAIAIQKAQQALLDATADATLEEGERTQQEKAYSEAIQHFNNAENYATKTATFQDTAQSASTHLAATKLQLQNLPTVDPAKIINGIDDLDSLSQQVDTVRSRLTQLNQSNSDLQQALAELEQRPQDITERLVQANAELSDANAALTATKTENPGNSSKQTLLTAQTDELTAEINMLKQETAGQSSRSERLNSKLRLTGRTIKNTKATLVSLDFKLNRARMSEAERLIAEVADLVTAAAGKGPAVDSLAVEVSELVLALKESTNQLQTVNQSYDDIVEKTYDLQTGFSQFQKEINLGGLDGILSQVYIEQQRALPNPQQIFYSVKKRAETLRNIRLEQFSLRERIQNQRVHAQQFKEPLEAEVTALLEKREELLNQLLEKYSALFQHMTQVDLAERDFGALLVKVRGVFRDKLFWKKSSPPLWQIESIDAKGAICGLFGSRRLIELKSGLAAALQSHRYASGLFAILFLALLLYRPRLKRLVLESGKRIQNTSNDRFTNTLWATYGTILLSLPIPLSIGALSWILSQDPLSSDWLQGITTGLQWCFIIAAWTFFLITCCSSYGLGPVHFGWKEPGTKEFRRCLYSFLLICIPSLLIICSMAFEETSVHFDSVGRIFFILILIWTFWILKRLLNTSNGVFSRFHKENPERFETKTAPFWSLLLIVCPIILIVLTVQGYFITSLVLALELLAVIGLITIGSICYYFSLRWFMIKERKLALAEAIKERNERIEAARKKDEQEESVELVVPNSAPELDLEKVGQQTRNMLRSLFTIAVIIEIWFLATHTLPIDEALGAITYRGWLRPLDLFYAAAILTIMTVVVKNLPGLLELSGLRESNIDVGARYAITTISQYIVGAIGLALTCSVLHVNWSMFGWIATALSVGLGFGLQEIVSNFVCGIILLFERPIRIGDVITINNVTGTVSRIRMRATTIINWDRQELIVPNKQFISDALINWTLTNSVNRIIISVGVAYGTDTIRAKEILTQIAQQHPLVLEDPAPLATFEEFGDSSLLLRLRVYLPDLTERINVISSLHDTIDQHFKAANIEIAFPQQDLHIRSIDDTVIKNTGINKPCPQTDNMS
ncbi:MAG: potassium efflux system protein [Lentimonas sp.]